MKEKLILMVISILTLGLFAFTGCSKPVEKETEKEAEQVSTEFFNKLYCMESTKAKEILNSEDKIASVHNEFKAFTTKEELVSMISNRVYSRMLQFSKSNESSIKLQKLDLVKRSYYDKGKKIIYDYTVTIDVTYDKDNKKETTEEKGIITLVAEGDSWNVFSNKITMFSSLLMKQ